MNRSGPRLCLLVLLLIAGPLCSQSVLEGYVEEGLKCNLALRQKRFDLEQSVQALREARGRFFPSLALEARATRAGGGRAIEIPVGELLNDVHDALNTLLGFPRFPTDVGPETLPIQPEREQETRLSVVQPLFVPRLTHDYRIKGFLKSSREEELALYRRLLRAEIREAYYNHFKARGLVEVLERSMDLLAENLRVSELLFARGKATEDVVFRARSEIAALRLEQAAADKQQRISSAWFNFLLNRGLEEPIEGFTGEEPCGEADLAAALARSLALREELALADIGLAVRREAVRMAESARLPELSAAFVYGIQGESYRFSTEADFWTGSVLLQWQLYSGGQVRARTEQARLAEQGLATRREEIRAQIRLEVQTAWADLVVAHRSREAAEEWLNSARAYFHIISRKYEAGISSQIQYMDARTQLTQAEINRMIARYDSLIACARFESVTAVVNAPQTEGGGE